MQTLLPHARCKKLHKVIAKSKILWHASGCGEKHVGKPKNSKTASARSAVGSQDVLLWGEVCSEAKSVKMPQKKRFWKCRYPQFDLGRLWSQNRQTLACTIFSDVPAAFCGRWREVDRSQIASLSVSELVSSSIRKLVSQSVNHRVSPSLGSQVPTTCRFVNGLLCHPSSQEAFLSHRFLPLETSAALCSTTGVLYVWVGYSRCVKKEALVSLTCQALSLLDVVRFYVSSAPPLSPPLPSPRGPQLRVPDQSGTCRTWIRDCVLNI